jgi:RNA polymerase sigma-70 factor (ECF subfamily)
MFKKTLSNVVALFSITDEQAMWRVRMDDDQQAFTLLMERWHDRIHALCARMVGSIHTAEDLAQEVFARIFEKRKDYDPEKRFSTWLWCIAVNRCYDELRRVHRRPEFSLDAQEDETGLLPEALIENISPVEHASERDEAQVVRKALAKLPEMYRAVIILRHYHGLKLREVAEVLGVPDGTVNSRMAEALVQLSALLEPSFPDYKAHRSRADKRNKDGWENGPTHFTLRTETAQAVTTI